MTLSQVRNVIIEEIKNQISYSNKSKSLAERVQTAHRTVMKEINEHFFNKDDLIDLEIEFSRLGLK